MRTRIHQPNTKDLSFIRRKRSKFSKDLMENGTNACQQGVDIVMRSFAMNVWIW